MFENSLEDFILMVSQNISIITRIETKNQHRFAGNLGADVRFSTWWRWKLLAL